VGEHLKYLVYARAPRSADCLRGVVLGTEAPGQPRPVHRLEQGGTPSQHRAAGVQHALSDIALGKGAPSGFAHSGSHGPGASTTSDWLRSGIATHSNHTGDVGQRQGVDEVAISLGPPAVLDHVDLEDSRRGIAPVGEGAHRDAATNGGADAFAASTLAVDMRSRVAQRTVDRRGAYLQQPCLDECV